MDTNARRAASARAFIALELKRGHAWSERHYSYDYQEDGMDYLAIYDDNPKHDIAQKIASACAAYEARFGARPTVALVCEDDHAPAVVSCVTTRAEKRIGRNVVHVGNEQQEDV